MNGCRICFMKANCSSRPENSPVTKKIQIYYKIYRTLKNRELKFSQTCRNA